MKIGCQLTAYSYLSDSTYNNIFISQLLIINF